MTAELKAILREQWLERFDLLGVFPEHAQP
jgi:hypothetical protein